MESPRDCKVLHHVLVALKNQRADHFREQLRLNPTTFDTLVAAIEDDPVFVNQSNNPQMFTLHPPGYSTWNGYGMDGIHKIGYGFHGIGDGFHLHRYVFHGMCDGFHLHSTPSFHGHSTFIPWSFHLYFTLIPWSFQPYSTFIPPSFHMESRFNNLFYMQFSTYSVMDSIWNPYGMTLLMGNLRSIKHQRV